MMIELPVLKGCSFKYENRQGEAQTYMAIVFTLLSMLMVCGEDLYEKKSVSSSVEEALKTLVWYGIFNAIVLCALLFFGLEETSVMPHELILDKPMVLLNSICSYICLFFALAAYKYVGVSVRNTFANVDGLFYILFLVIYHLITGNAGFAERLFTPTMAIGLILILGVTIIYPSLKDAQGEKREKPPYSKTALKIGIALAIISALFDGADSFVSSVLIGDSIVNSMEFIAANALVQVVISVLVWIYLWIRNKEFYNPFRKTEKYRFISQAFSAAGDVLYVFALSGDALLGVILWNVFPVLDILGARILMKEKLSRTQYLVLLALIIGAVLVSIS